MAPSSISAATSSKLRTGTYGPHARAQPALPRVSGTRPQRRELAACGSSKYLSEVLDVRPGGGVLSHTQLPGVGRVQQVFHLLHVDLQVGHLHLTHWPGAWRCRGAGAEHAFTDARNEATVVALAAHHTVALPSAGLSVREHAGVEASHCLLHHLPTQRLKHRLLVPTTRTRNTCTGTPHQPRPSMNEAPPRAALGRAYLGGERVALLVGPERVVVRKRVYLRWRSTTTLHRQRGSGSVHGDYAWGPTPPLTAIERAHAHCQVTEKIKRTRQAIARQSLG